jgi:hypothetical protein
LKVRLHQGSKDETTKHTGTKPRSLFSITCLVAIACFSLCNLCKEHHIHDIRKDTEYGMTYTDQECIMMFAIHPATSNQQPNSRNATSSLHPRFTNIRACSARPFIGLSTTYI